MDNRKNQKQLELADTKRFLQCAKIGYDELDPFTKDPPDLILKIKEKIIGVEHSTLITQGGDRIIPITQEYVKVIKEAQRLYERLEMPPLNVFISFKDSIDTSKGKEKNAISELLNLIVSSVSLIKDNGSFSVEEERLLPYTSTVRISKNRHGENLWQRLESFWAGPLSSEFLTYKVDEKNSKLSTLDCLEVFDEMWLLLVVRGKEWSEFSDYRPNDFVWNPTWCFNKVIVYGVFADEYEIFQK